MVFDTSLLAAFDAPGVDPAAQQQAANLLSQQSFQPQSISPPSFSGGAGLSEPRPQTVTPGAPYYDPIAIHSGNAPVYYDTYTGPSVDMSNYLGNLFSPSNTGTLNYGPVIGGSGWATSTSDPTSQYGGTNSSFYQPPPLQSGPGPLGGMIANRIGGGIDTLRNIGSAIGDIQIPTGWRGQTSIGEQLGNVADVYNTDIPYYSDAMRNTIIPALKSGIDTVAPYTPIAPYNVAADAIGLPSAGEIAGWAAPVTAGDVALELVPGLGTVPDAWRLASRLAPDATDFANVIRRGGQALDTRIGQLGPGELGAARVPGGAPDPNKMTPENISSISRRLKGGDEKPIFEGVETAPTSSVLERYRLAPDRVSLKELQDESARLTKLHDADLALGAAGDFRGGRVTKDRLAALIERRLELVAESAPRAVIPTVEPSVSPYIPGTEAYARGKSTPDLPDYSNDPGYWESMAKQADAGGNPARSKPAPVKRTVTMGDGTAVDASPENIQQAVDRYLRRPTTQKAIKVDPAKIADDPEAFLDTVAEQVAHAKTRGGRPLMQGVTPDEVKQVLMNQGAVKVNPTGPAEIVAKQDETLESALAKVDSGDPGPPEPPDLPRLTPRGDSPNNRVWNAFLQAWNLPRSLLASLDFSYPLRQGGMLIRHGNEWANSFGAGFKAFRDDEFATQVMDALTGRKLDGSLGKIHISTLRGGLIDREEEFASALLDKIPGFRRSAQANIIFINKLRADTYDSVIRMWDRTGQKYTQTDVDALANYINRATGRGTLGDFEEAAGALATGIFSPRHLASRVQAPGYLIHKSRLVRNEAWKDVTAFAGAISGLLALADMSGVADVELDPRSADFGKLRVGNTRVDLWTGYQQIGRLIALVGTGELKSSSGAIYGIKAGDALLNFARGKLHPSLGAAADQFIFGGKNVIGENIDWSPGEAANRLVPLAFQSMYDAINEGDPLQIALSGLGLVGGGVSTYPSTGEERNKLIVDMGFKDATTGEPITEWHKLSSAQKAEAKAQNPALNDLSTPSPTTEARDAERTAAWDKLKQTGDFDAYFAQYSAISDKYAKEFAAQEFPELKNPGEWAKKLQDFYDKSAEITDAVAKQEFREAFEASLNPDEQAAFKAGQQSSDPNYRKLQAAMDMLQPRYYDLREAAFNELKAKVPARFGQYETYTDVFESGTSQDQKDVGTRIAAEMREVRKADPQADAMLYILGRSEYVMTAQAKAIVDATLAKEGINKKSPNIGRP